MAQDVYAGEGAARSVQGPMGGLCLTSVDTTGDTFTVTEWKGRYVIISALGAAGFYNFSGTNNVNQIDATATADDTAATDATVPDLLQNGVPVRVMVPDLGEGKDVYLIVAAQSTTADFRVRKA